MLAVQGPSHTPSLYLRQGMEGGVVVWHLIARLRM